MGREEAYKKVQELSRQVWDNGTQDFITILENSGLFDGHELTSITDLSDLHSKIDLIYERAEEFINESSE
jgi:adenylosuccinate lyase